MSEGSNGGSRVAVYRGSGTIEIEDRPRPVPADGQVLVEISHCGICGSDVHLMFDGWGPTDVVQGHEYSGVVAAVGGGVERWRVGDQVTCGGDSDPDAAVGHGEPGGFGTHVVVDAGALCAVPAGLPLRAAALAEPLAVALHAITRSGIGSGSGSDESALVFGAGPIGALVVAALRARGGTHVGVVEPAPGRQELARRLGADSVVHPDDLPDFSPFSPATIAEGAVPVVFECSGKRKAMEAGLGMLRRGGRLVMVGAGIEPPRFDPNRLLLNELTVTGAFCYDDGGIDAALALLAGGELPVDVLLEPDDIGLDGLGPALAQLAGGEIAGKVLVRPAPGPTAPVTDQGGAT